MFAVNEMHKGLQEERTRVLSVLHSINEPKIAAADHPAEPTKAFVITLGDDDPAQLRTHIVLYLTKTKDRVMYSWQDGSYPQEERTAIEEEALDFVENMGFMMDNLNLEALDEGARKEVINELPVFDAEALEVVGSDSGDAQLDELDLLDDLDLLEEVERDAAESDELPDLLMEEELGGSRDTSVRAGMLDGVKEEEIAVSQPDLSSPGLDDAAMELMEEEFSRSPDELEQELDSVVSALETNVKPKSLAPEKEAVAPQGHSGVFQALVRLMASF